MLYLPNKKTTILLLLSLLFLHVARAEIKIIPPVQKHATSFALIIDEQSYQKTESAVEAYKTAVENDGLSAYIVVNRWKSPEQIRSVIRKLAGKQSPLEGIVLIGDVPIPMIRDAQHLTSAFKMDQDNPRFPFIRSSVPSDRFYDDFDLQFRFIRQDSANPLLFYYSLKPESPQRIQCDIYSARMKPAVAGEKKYGTLKKYLLRIAAQKKRQNELDYAMVVTGQGYHSESLISWSNEMIGLREQLPQLFNPGGELRTFYHSMSPNLKERILTAMQQPELDFAIFHAHGADDKQYLLGQEPAETIAENVASIQRFLRNKLRQAKRRKQSIAQRKKYYMDKYGVPENYFAGAFSDSVIAADSSEERKMDIFLDDIANISPAAKFILFDECFNGAFIHREYVAGKYVFGAGATIAAAANTVNVLQDINADEFIGLLSSGLRIGQWHRFNHYLESHIIGDPTFHFTFTGKFDFNKYLTFGEKNTRLWNSLLKDSSPVVRALALRKMFENRREKFEAALMDFYHADASFIVRLQALNCLAQLRSTNFEAVLSRSIRDPYELIRRYSAKWMGDVGNENYLPALVDNLLFDPAKRVNAGAWDAVAKISSEKAAQIAEERIRQLPLSETFAAVLKRLRSSARRNHNWINELIAKIRNDSLQLKKRISAVRTFRNYRFQEALPTLLQLAENEKYPLKLRTALIEMLGWFTFSHNRREIIAVCDKISAQQITPGPVKAEALKTKKRLLAGANNPFTP